MALSVLVPRRRSRVVRYFRRVTAKRSTLQAMAQKCFPLPCFNAASPHHNVFSSRGPPLRTKLLNRGVMWSRRVMHHPEAVCLSVKLLWWKLMMASCAVCGNAAPSGSAILHETPLFSLQHEKGAALLLLSGGVLSVQICRRTLQYSTLVFADCFRPS